MTSIFATGLQRDSHRDSRSPVAVRIGTGQGGCIHPLSSPDATTGAWQVHPDKIEIRPDATDFYFANLHRADAEYLADPRQYPEPCPACGGRLQHGRACAELLGGIVMPFGKHEGKPLADVPRRYLTWVAGRDRLNADLRDTIRNWLRLP